MLPHASGRKPRGGSSLTSAVIGFVALIVLAFVFIGTAALLLERSDASASGGLRSRIEHAERGVSLSASRFRILSSAAAATAAGVLTRPGGTGSDGPGDEGNEAGGAEGAGGLGGGVAGGTGGSAGLASALETHPDPECAALIRESSDVMFMIVGGRGYHDVRVRVMLRSWARCVAHVLVFTDPSLDVGEYLSPYRSVYLLAGDAWRRRPFLPMSHMDALHRLFMRPNSPAMLSVRWYFLVSDRTFVNVRALLRTVSKLKTTSKGYYGQVAEASHKESFGFHEYVDINGGVLLSSALMSRVADPDSCADQKDAAGTYDMFDAKLGNCVFYLGARAQPLPGFGVAEQHFCVQPGAAASGAGDAAAREASGGSSGAGVAYGGLGEAEAAADSDEGETEWTEEGEGEEPASPGDAAATGVPVPSRSLLSAQPLPAGPGGPVTVGKVDPAHMVRLSTCTGLLSADAAAELIAWEAAQRYPLEPEAVAVHVMARETQLMAIVESCESTWGLPLPKLYYHVDRIVAAESFPISRGRWGISANLAADASPGEFPRRHGEPSLLNRSAAAAAASRPRHRVAALILPERPSTQGEHWTISHDKGMTWNTWLRFKMRAIFDYSVRAHWAEIRETEWFVYVDDDTYVLWEPLLELLRRYDPRTAHYFGRPLHEAGYPLFVGGGAGIVLSRAAADQLSAVRDSDACDPLNLKWTDRMHSGGDAWLGDCAENAGVHTDMEFGFYPQPPVSNLFSLYKDAVAFHGVENHAAMHAALAANGSDAAYDPRCVPVFVDHKYNCLPHFIIGGVPKAGTTSLYKYLMQHPDVVPAEDKELTFWGNFFTPKHRPGRDEVMSDYLTRFPKISPSDFKVTGEATPGYLFCLTCPTYILKYMPKVRLLFTLRNPVPRAYSEYLNKVVDRTVVRYLAKRIDNKMEKELSDDAPPFESIVDDVARTMGSCGSPNRTFSMMDEYSTEMDEAGCYVNPFVGEGRYARYLRLWLGMVPKRQLMILNFDEWTASDEAAQASMGDVAQFLQLSHFEFRVSEAHNTHANRSVHVDKDAASAAAAIKAQAVEAELPVRTRCILHDFFQPFNSDLAHLLAQYGYPPMTHTWQSGSGCNLTSLWRFANVLPAAPHANEVVEEAEQKICGTVDHPCLAGSDVKAI